MSGFDQVPWALVAPVLVVQLILWCAALIDLKRIYATNGPKWLWLLLILCGGVVGSIVYFIIGRKQS
ncbi:MULTISPECIES: PLD nuclease N-terminal domain-containing protein [Bacillales]|uniref:PLD nuclease N-terminal domain-containing protein n=1 Tax=Lysinibacillus louembei TaxID=1470088 RepID=A0ABZ0RWZ5_9BACI|nr:MULTISPECIES: PLD nuclease N-terminal domain-containing protein [Bacillales]MCT6926216.1 PLD nuclease N-terminal domain-containing protein [Metasolibacillus sp.]MCT6942448.1 PLD nuclease N-terminal domain-containing protein [Metasolibacillus sp.]WPK11767.1 PLD nuclease N-terminal domain-containing protein [Lysinibacillus louembei]